MSRSLTSFKRSVGNRIAYGERGSLTFDEIFKKHPLHSPKNEPNFRNMNLITMDWGAKKDIRILNSGYTLNLLKKIAENDVRDVVNFFELAKLTVLRFNKENLLNNESWFKKVSTMFWLSVPNAPEGLNYWTMLSEKQKEGALQLGLEFYGDSAYKNIASKNLGINNINEKMIYLFLHSNVHLHQIIDSNLNKIEEVVKYTSTQNKPINYDILTAMIDVRKINPYVINMCINYPSALNFKKINIPVASLKESKSLVFASSEEAVPLKDFYELVNVQSWLIKKANSYSKKSNEKINDFSFTPYSTCLEILSTYDRSNEFIQKSLLKFVIEKEFLCTGKSSKEEIDMWMMAKIEVSLLEKSKSKIIKKI